MCLNFGRRMVCIAMRKPYWIALAKYTCINTLIHPWFDELCNVWCVLGLYNMLETCLLCVNAMKFQFDLRRNPRTRFSDCNTWSCMAVYTPMCHLRKIRNLRVSYACFKKRHAWSCDMKHMPMYSFPKVNNMYQKTLDLMDIIHYTWDCGYSNSPCAATLYMVMCWMPPAHVYLPKSTLTWKGKHTFVYF